MERYVDAPHPTGSGGRFAAKISQRIQILSDKSAPYVAGDVSLVPASASRIQSPLLF